MQYFIASSWKNMKEVQLLTENLTALGNQVFSYVTDKRNFVPRTELEQREFASKDWKSDPEIKELYDKDMRGLSQSDAFIMLLPAGNSSHIEAGIAFALGKKTILVGNPQSIKTHYLIFQEHYGTIGEYITKVKDEHQKTPA